MCVWYGIEECVPDFLYERNVNYEYLSTLHIHLLHSMVGVRIPVVRTSHCASKLDRFHDV